ncbi:uncharacterized protein LOC126816608 isoform X3 [Patella vulgata]|nr:uncharacterized protein LOC126816608 isoform X3 [Patella vulgata]
MIIRLAILLHTQSPQAYRSLKQTGLLHLPGESTLRDYSNAISPTHGFNPNVINDLKDMVKDLKDNERWVVLIHDEMTIKSDLVLASTSDKASPNQRLIDMHREDKEAIYSTNNIFARERQIYFVSDVPHLLKTLRNNLANSGSGLKTRYLWNDGKHLLWSHVRQVFIEDSKSELRRTKLTPAHVDLNSYSVMKVNLAAQVMSKTVSSVMKAYMTEDTWETANFIEIVDRLFDCLNVRSKSEGNRVKKTDLMPYTDVEDKRFEFLLNDALGYFKNWKFSVENREGFGTSEKSKMFISAQTYKGLFVTINSVVEATKYLLSCGVKEVYTNSFCQDPLESHFGNHRGLARRNDNPTLYAFGYQENKIRLQRNLSILFQSNKGNIEKESGSIKINAQPLKKRKL